MTSPTVRNNFPSKAEIQPHLMEFELLEQFRYLRAETHRRMCLELAERIAIEPLPTAEEESMGVYLESIEPQVRPATMALRAKGWDTNCSGFGGPNFSQSQGLQFSGNMLLDKTIEEKIKIQGAELLVLSGAMTYEIRFEPEIPDIDAITQTWSLISEHLPELGEPINSTRSHWTDRVFVINALNIGMCADQLVGSPFATEVAIEEALSLYKFSSRHEHRPLV